MSIRSLVDNINEQINNNIKNIIWISLTKETEERYNSHM